jgi:hypothetical protein
MALIPLKMGHVPVNVLLAYTIRGFDAAWQAFGLP